MRIIMIARASSEKEFSFDNGGDGPVGELSSPPSEQFIQPAFSRYKYDTYIHNVSLCLIQRERHNRVR